MERIGDNTNHRRILWSILPDVGDEVYDAGHNILSCNVDVGTVNLRSNCHGFISILNFSTAFGTTSVYFRDDWICSSSEHVASSAELVLS